MLVSMHSTLAKEGLSDMTHHPADPSEVVLVGKVQITVPICQGDPTVVRAK